MSGALQFETHLRVPGNAAFADVVRAFADDAAARCLDADARAKLGEAAELAFHTVIDEALSAKRGPIRVVARCRAHALEIGFIERGLPVDDAFARRDSRFNDIAALVDEAHWLQHGTAGCELRLTVRRSPGTRDRAHVQHPAPAAEAPRAPEQTYTIRRYQTQDGPGVTRCFYEAWGYNYPLKGMYVPARVSAMNAGGDLHSFVAIAEDGEVAGHYGLRPHPNAPLAEGGNAAVMPAHRGRSLMERLRAGAEGAAPSLGFAALYFEPVTDHVFTQRANERDGAHLCGISLGISPARTVQPGMELSTTSQRQSLMLYVKALDTATPRTIYPPPRHRAMIARMYDGLGIVCETPSAAAPASGDGAIRVSADASKHVGRVSVDRIGPETIVQALQAYHDLLRTQHAAAIYVELPLADPRTPELCEALERAGCYFSGIGPWMLDGSDALRLQHVAAALDLTKLSVFSDFGKELLAYISDERQRTGG